MAEPPGRTRLLLVMPSSALTGGPRVLLNFLERLDHQRFEPFVILGDQGPLVDELRRRQVRFEVIGLRAAGTLQALRDTPLLARLGVLAEWYRYNAALRDTMVRAGTDLVWARNLKGVLLSGLGARRLGRRLIWDVGLEKPGVGMFRWLNLAGLLIAHTVVTEGSSQPEQIFGARIARRFAGKIRTINPGISESRVSEIRAAVARGKPDVLRNRAELNLLQVGTLCPRKNQLLAVRAMAQLRERSVCLHLVGGPVDGAYCRELERYVDAHRLGGRVVFYGWSDEIPEYLAAADLLLMTSLNEGIPYAVHEAMHAGLPVIVTAAGGMADAVVPDVTGRIVPAGSLDALVEAIGGFIEHPELLRAMGEAGRRLVSERFSGQQWYEAYQSLFAECLGEAQAG